MAINPEKHINPPEPPTGQVLVYQDGSQNIQVRLDGETVWLTQAQIAELYQTTPQNITIHIRSIYDENELKMSYKNIDIILAGLERKINKEDIIKQAKIKKADYDRIKNMRLISQHKRRSPLIPKLGIRTPGYDWRSPVLTG